MRLCHFIASRGFGGMEKMVVDLCNALAEKHTLSVVLPQGCHYRHRFASSITIHTFPASHRYNPWSYLSLFWFFKRSHYDSVTTHGAKATFFFYWLNRYFKIPHVAVKHNDRKNTLFYKIKTVVAISHAVQKSLSGHTTHLIYNGIPASTPIPHTLEPAPFNLLCVGRLEPIKGFDLLLKMLTDHPLPLTLYIAGEGPQRAYLEHLSSTLPHFVRVVFLGFQESIPAYMHAVDAVIIPSLKEGFSLVAIEALVHAKLLISTPVGICNEILTEQFLCDHEGMFAKLAETITHYSEYTKAFSILQNQLKDRFSIEHCAHHYETLYASLLENP